MSEADDDHLVQLGKAMRGKVNGKGPHQANEQHVSVPVAGPVIDNRNQISTPALLGMLILSIGMSAVAIGVAIMAEREAQNAEREARVALNHSEENRVQNEVNKVLIETYVMRKEK